jgi:hypothetical protein
MGFAYYPDGAHDDKDELEPSIVPPGSSSTCGDTNKCPAPMYFRDGSYLGNYTNLPSIDEPIAVTRQNDLESDDFGLDHYEPLFFHPLGDWLSYGDFEIVLYFDDTELSQDMFYFCHVSCSWSFRMSCLVGLTLHTTNSSPLFFYDNHRSISSCPAVSS